MAQDLDHFTLGQIKWNRSNKPWPIQIFFFRLKENGNISVSYEGFMTMIDGKIANALTNCPSTRHCPICHTFQNNFREKTAFEVIGNSLDYGLSILHFGPRSMEAILKMGYNQGYRCLYHCDVTSLINDSGSRISFLIWQKFGSFKVFMGQKWINYHLLKLWCHNGMNIYIPGYNQGLSCFIISSDWMGTMWPKTGY